MNQTNLMTFCSQVMGSDALAREWMPSPAMELDNRRPADLLSTEDGRAEVEVLLTRLEYGVYT